MHPASIRRAKTGAKRFIGGNGRERRASRRVHTVLALAVIVMPLALATSAFAASSTTEVTVTVDFVSVDTTLCAFPIAFTSNGSYKVKTFYDDAGNPVKSILTNFTERFVVTASANGKRLTSNDPVVYLTSFADNTVVNVGLVYAFHVRGAGLVLLQTGRAVYDTTGFVSQTGPNQILDGDTEAFCGYFAP